MKNIHALNDFLPILNRFCFICRTA